MSIIRVASRLLVAGIFINGGLEAFREPAPRATTARPVIDRMTAALPGRRWQPEDVVRANAALQVAAGSALAIGILPRLAALGLIGSLIPTTAGGHRFWEHADPVKRGQQRIQFLKNAAILGALLLLALEPSSGPGSSRGR